MIEILKTQTFSDWFGSLRDRAAQRRIQARIDYLAVGGYGDAKRLTSTVSEDIRRAEKLAASLKLED